MGILIVIDLTLIFWPCLIPDCNYDHKIMYAFYMSLKLLASELIS